MAFGARTSAPGPGPPSGPCSCEPGRARAAPQVACTPQGVVAADSVCAPGAGSCCRARCGLAWRVLVFTERDTEAARPVLRRPGLHGAARGCVSPALPAPPCRTGPRLPLGAFADRRLLPVGVGGIETEAVMLGLPVSLTLPQVVGCEVTGTPNAFVTSIDVVLGITKVGRFVTRNLSAVYCLSQNACGATVRCCFLTTQRGLSRHSLVSVKNKPWC